MPGRKKNGNKNNGNRKQAKPRRRNVRRNGNRNGNGNGTARTNATSVLAQGAGRITTAVFAGDKAAGPSLACWNALLPQHLSLPRAIGPYLTVRLTKRFSSNKQAQIFAFFLEKERLSHPGHGWTDVCNIHPRFHTDYTVPVNATDSTYYNYIPGIDAFGTGATWCPAALTVQIMNPNPLQTTEGILYAGVTNTQLQFGGSTKTYENIVDDFVAFQSPRILSAGKLALRGVELSSHPLNMSAISDFTPVQKYEPYVTTPGSEYGDWNQGLQPTGFAPIVLSNPQQVELEYLVTTEWRLRFSMESPAVAAHTHHPVSSDYCWDSKMKKALDGGNKCIDIAERVANLGESMMKGMKGLSIGG